MERQLKTVIGATQQEITTTINREEESFEVQILAAPALDRELRNGFHDLIDTLGNESVSVRSHTRRSNQGNDLWEVVTVSFPKEKQLTAIDIIGQAIEFGKEQYQKQVERELVKETEEDYPSRARRKQQMYFEDEDLKEFCLLLRGKVDDL